GKFLKKISASEKGRPGERPYRVLSLLCRLPTVPRRRPGRFHRLRAQCGCDTWLIMRPVLRKGGRRHRETERLRSAIFRRSHLPLRAMYRLCGDRSPGGRRGSTALLRLRDQSHEAWETNLALRRLCGGGRRCENR